MLEHLGLCLLLLVPAQPDDPVASERARIAAAAREVHRRGGYPNRLFTGPGRIPEIPPADSRPAKTIDLTLVGYLLAGLAGVLLAVAALNHRRSSAVVPARPGTPAAARPVVADEPMDPGELARAGRFAEALAALLLAGLRLTGWDPRGERGLTAREVVGRVERGHPLREALAELLGLAEAVHFAGERATAEHVGRARAALERAGGSA